MKKQKKKQFVVSEVQSGVVLYFTKIFAVSKKSLWRTSLMRNILVNKSAESIIMIREV